MRSNAEGGRYAGIHFVSGTWSSQRVELIDDVTISLEGPIQNYFDPNGSDRDITLPEIKAGLIYTFHFLGSDANVLNIRDANGTLVVQLEEGMSSFVMASEQEWSALRGWSDLDDFVGAGPGHRRGLVPDPGPIAQALRFLREDGVWAEAMDDGNVDAFKFITDGSVIAEATGGDTFKFRSSTNKVGITVQSNDGTHGDNVNLTVLEAQVDHDALLNFVADEHIAHSSVTIGGEEGITGGGNITASRLVKLAFAGLTAAAPVLADTIAFLDATDSLHKKSTWGGVNAILVHNDLVGYEADRHVAHSTISVVAGIGLSGGGTIDATRTLNVDFTEFDTETPSLTHTFFFYTGTEHAKNTLAVLNGILDHDSLAGYQANRHFDHTLISIAAGTGLTGGGTIAADRSLALDAASIASLAKADTALQPAAIGTTVQAYDADLTTWAGLTPSANAQSLVTAANFAAMRTLLSLVPGTDVLPVANPTTTGTFTNGGAEVHIGDITPTTLAANTDDYAPTSLSTANRIRLSASVAVELTGLTGGTDGRRIVLHNISAFAITLKDDVTSTAANRFALNGDIALSQDQSIELEYDGTSARWRAIGGIGGGGAGVSDGDKGDITASGGGSIWTIDDNVVTLAKMQDIATASFLGRTTAASGDPEVLTATQATALLNAFTSLLKGLVPASGGGTANFLRADGTWNAPPNPTLASLGGVPAPSTAALAVDSVAVCQNASGGSIAINGTTSGSNVNLYGTTPTTATIGAAQSGTWKNVHGVAVGSGGIGLFVRTA